MLEISGKTNLLEQNAYKYSLQDVAEPNLHRDIYTQGMVPKVPFNHRRVPMNMPEEIWISQQLAVVDPVAVFTVRQRFRAAVGRELRTELRERYAELRVGPPYRYDPVDAGRRSLRNLCLAYLLAAGPGGRPPRCPGRFK